MGLNLARKKKQKKKEEKNRQCIKWVQEIGHEYHEIKTPTGRSVLNGYASGLTLESDNILTYCGCMRTWR
jgi:hypothetical protein